MHRLTFLGGVRCADAPRATLRRRAPAPGAAALRPPVARCAHADLGSEARPSRALLLAPRRSHSSKAEVQVGGYVKAHASRLGLTHKLEKEVHSLQIRLRAEGANFDKWRRRNIALLLTTGGVAGGITLAVLGTVYVRRHPHIIDYVVAWLAKVEFDATASYQGRKQLYMDLPEPQFSVSSLEAKIHAVLTDGAHSASAEAAQAGDDDRFGRLGLAWASMTTTAFTAMDGSWLLATKAAMRRELIDEICSGRFCTSLGADDTTVQADPSAVIASKLAELRDILPLSLERNTYVAAELSKYMDARSPEDRCECAPNSRVLRCVSALRSLQLSRALLLNVPHMYNSLTSIVRAKCCTNRDCYRNTGRGSSAASCTAGRRMHFTLTISDFFLSWAN